MFFLIFVIPDQSYKRAYKYKPEPENINLNPARTRKVIWSQNLAWKCRKLG